MKECTMLMITLGLHRLSVLHDVFHTDSFLWHESVSFVFSLPLARVWYEGVHIVMFWSSLTATETVSTQTQENDQNYHQYSQSFCSTFVRKFAIWSLTVYCWGIWCCTYPNNEENCNHEYGILGPHLPRVNW